jgi:diguanylate cyclase (GGDEF)-like protein
VFGAGPSGDERDADGEARDRDAVERDRRADDRDREAARRDRRAQTRDRAGDVEQAPSARAASRTASEHDEVARDRAAAADDRRRAGVDRQCAAQDRADAAKERAVAATDELTGVLRRGVGMLELQRDIDRARRSGEPLVVAFVDVDGLKRINDEHGHQAGDAALRSVANVLRTGLRSYDAIMRYGGDEILCALPGLSRTTAMERMLRLRAALSTATKPVFVTFGLAELQPHDDINTVVARADAALYDKRGRTPSRHSRAVTGRRTRQPGASH